jgi:large subunit ribosomal protein L9
MDVILTERVDNLGEMGETVTVARGYARNYLIPRGLAVVASEGARRAVMERVALSQRRDAERRSAAEDLARQYADRDLSVTFGVQAGEDDRLFGSVSVRDIAAALTEQGIEVEHRQIQLDEPIKQLGVYTVPLFLHAQVEVPLKVWVTRAE